MEERPDLAELRSRVAELMVRVRRDCVAVRRQRRLQVDPTRIEAQLRASRVAFSRERRRLAQRANREGAPA